VVKIELVAAFLIAAALPAAADGIRPGKWEYTVTAQMPNMPQLPPKVQVPAAGGMTATHTSCVTSNDPAAELSKPRGPAAGQSRCNVERIDRTVGAVSWVTACTIPEGVSRSEGTARYTADRVEADSRTRTTHQNGAPLEVSNHIVGRYLGPCDGR
jgi:hypothetical protein